MLTLTLKVCWTASIALTQTRYCVFRDDFRASRTLAVVISEAAGRIADGAREAFHCAGWNAAEAALR